MNFHAMDLLVNAKLIMLEHVKNIDISIKG